MFSIITKAEYFDWLDRGFCSLDRQELKNIQDGFALSLLHSLRGGKILEAGGGNSRVLPRLDRSCELWNADKFEGDGNGPTAVNDSERIRLVRSFIGDLDPEIPADYFDAVFSISVIEHIPCEAMDAFIDDIIRILKPGGIAVHAVDLSIGDATDQTRIQFQNQNAKIALYRDLTNSRLDKIEWLEPSGLSLPVIASAKYAANSNNTLYRWARRAPERRAHREICQSVSLKWGFRKQAC